VTPFSAPARAGEEKSLGSRALRAAFFAFGKRGGGQVVRLLSNLVLTRLLMAEAFGLMALVAVLLQALDMFSDIGIGPSIIRSERGDDPAFLDTIWTVQLVRGVGVWIIACVVAAPFAHLYNQPLLAQMIPVAGFNAVLNGLLSTKLYTQNRRLHLGRVMVQELAAQIAGTLVMIVLAYVWRTVWALVAGAVLTTALRSLLSYVLLPGRNNRLRWEPAARAELMGFGRWVFLSTMLTFTSQSADRLIFGKLVAIDVLGVYGIGKMMAAAPAEAMSHIGLNVVFPYYSEIVTSGKPLRDVYDRARRPLLVFSGACLSLLAASGGALIDTLYDRRYAAAGWVVQVLAIGAWFNVLWSTNVAALLALGKSKWMAATTFVKTLAIIALVPLGFRLHGFSGAVAGLAVAEVVQLVVSSAAVARQKLCSIWQDVPLSLLVLTSTLAGFWAGPGIAHSHVPALLGATLVVITMWAPVAWPLLAPLRRGQLVFGR
jgi:O-antigen/teichoic acid export membrane protein